jgi:hypothetical protein
MTIQDTIALAFIALGFIAGMLLGSAAVQMDYARTHREKTGL